LLTIQRIYKEYYPAGIKVIYRYTSEKYYKVLSEKIDNGWNFTLKEESFDIPFVKRLEEEIFEQYKKGSGVYIAELDGKEAAIMVIQAMDWNNTLIIHDLYVEPQYQKHGTGRRLIDTAKQRAVELDVRAIVLETQTSNYPAIQFYLKNGFEIVGFNAISYSNDDVNKNEVRLEMAYTLSN